MDTMKTNKTLTGHLCILLATIFFGLNIPALKEVMPQWFTGIDATLFRIGGAACLFWITSIFIKNDKIDRKDWLSILLSGMVGLFFFIFFFNLGLQYSSPVDISIIMTTPPIIVVLASTIIFKQKLSKLKLFGVLLSLCGALMIILIEHHTGEGRTLKGNLFAILSALSYAFYLISMNKLSNKYHPVSLLRWVFLAGTIVAIPFCLKGVIHAPIFQHPELMPMLILAFTILFPTFIAYLLMQIAIKDIGHEMVSMYQYLIPVIASTVAIALGLDKLYWDQPVAVVIIIAGVYFASKADKREKAQKQQQTTTKT